MMKYLTPILLIGISIALFLVFVRPMYHAVFKADTAVDSAGTSLKAELDSYDQALNRSRELENQRDILVKKYNEINKTDVDKLSKLLPDNVDNIRLIIEIENIAFPYGMVLRDVRSDAGTAAPKTEVLAGGSATSSSNKDYGIWTLEFSTEGTYENFLNFIAALQNNLRIVDITSIKFSSDSSGPSNKNAATSSAPVYKYTFKVQTYWLKN